MSRYARGDIESDPGKSRWWCELPSHWSGANRHFDATGVSFTRRITSPSSIESVNTGMCFPCCSSAAMGKMIGVVFGSAATAGHARSVSSIVV